MTDDSRVRGEREKMRGFRASDSLWSACQAKAKAQNRSLSSVCRRGLELWLAGKWD